MTLDFNPAGGDAVLDLMAFDQRDRFAYAATPGTMPSSHPSPIASSNTSNMIPTPRSWPLSFDMISPASPQEYDGLPLESPSLQSASPISHHSPYQHHMPLTDWSLQQMQQQQQQQHQQPQQHHSNHQPHQRQSHQHVHKIHPHHHHHQHHMGGGPQGLAQFVQDPLIPFTAFPTSFPPSPLEYLPTSTSQPSLQEAAAIHASLQMEPAFAAVTSVEEAQSAAPIQWNPNMGMESWHDFQAINMDSFSRLSSSLGSHSPASSYLEVLSIPGSNGEGWSMIDFGAPLDLHSPSTAIFNPGQTLHLRSNSDSSDGSSSLDFGSYEEIAAPFNYSSPFSPSDSENSADLHNNHRHCFGGNDQRSHSHSHSHDMISPAVDVAPVPPKTTTTTISTAASPGRPHASGSGSCATPAVTPPGRRNSGPRKSPIAKATKTTVTLIRRTPNDKGITTVKKVGRRRGPLRPEQRKQASEIRKLRACLRCKFLKKTCDVGEPCAGCQPSHARLWQVPCTRIDIKDIAYFMKDWRGDYDHHMRRGVSVYNVKGFSQEEHLLWITHGYGYALPVMVREVYVNDDSCFAVDWVESSNSIEPVDYKVQTEKLDVGQQGISIEALSEYLDKHIDGQFEEFVDDHFDGTPFITDILKTAHRYWVKEQLPVIRKALKLVLAYNLTLHITMVESHGAETDLEGEIDDEYSRFHGRIVAPVMVNFQIKCALADMWRELQRDILEELSQLYSSVYSGDRLKNWPTIFLLATILLAVWEEIQFDSHYRGHDPDAIKKFCADMETTPVGVIVGLFHAISQKLPPFLEWNTADHGHILNNNPAVCEAMAEVREHVSKHEPYLRTRSESKFNRHDFDSLSNKFLSKLVIRAN